MSEFSNTTRLYLPDKAILSIDFCPFELVFSSKDIFHMAKGSFQLHLEFYLILQDNNGNNFDGIERELEIEQICGSPEFRIKFDEKTPMTKANVEGHRLTFAWLCSKQFYLTSEDLAKEAFIRVRFSQLTTEFLREGQFEVVTGPFGSYLQITFEYPKIKSKDRSCIVT